MSDGIAPVILQDRQLHQVPDVQNFYRRMVLIREVEETLLRLFGKGLVRGTVHTCLGQEAAAVGVVSALDVDRDIVCTNHRGHGHYLALTGDAHGLIAEVLGLPNGIVGGLGGSQHLQRGNFYANGILGGMAPIAAGMALAEKWAGSGATTTVFLGDGAMAEGAVYEALNMAALWQVPLLIAVEHNGVAQSTPSILEHAGDLGRRGEPFGIPTQVIDGNDVVAVHAAARHAVAAMRAGDGPQMLVMRTFRLGPHSKGDDQRPVAEIEAARQRQPIVRLREQLTVAWCDEVDTAITAEVAAIVAGLVPGAMA